MKTLQRMIGVMLVLSIAVCFAPAVWAADSADTGKDLPVLKLVPEDALAIVLINHLDKADEQIGKLTQEMQVPAPPGLLPMLKAMAGIQEGFDDHGSALLALMPGSAADSAPVAVIFVPVNDYKKFIAQFHPADASAEIAEVNIMGRPHVVAHKEVFAVLAHTSDKDTLKKVLDSTRSVAPVIASLDDWIKGQAISFVATPTGVTRGVSVARKAVEQMKAVLANAKDPSMKMAAGNMGIYDGFLDAAEKEVSAFAVGMHVDHDGGFHEDIRTVFVAGGSWSSTASSLPVPQGDRLACLPGGPYMLAFDGAMPKSFSKGMLNMSVGAINNMIKAGGGKELTEEQTKQLDDLMEKSMAGLRSMSMVMGSPKPGGSLYSNMAAVMKVNDAKQYMADYQEAMEKMSGILNSTGVQLPFIQEIKKVKINDADGLELTMDMSAMLKNMPKNPGSSQMLKLMFGSEGKMKAFIVPIDETTVAFSYINADGIARVKAACQNPQTSLAADADIAQTAKLLPAGAQWVGYLSPKGLVDFVSGFVFGMAPPGAAMPALPAFPQTPPIGFAAEASAKALDVQIVIPGAAMKGVGTYVTQMHQMMAPTRQPQIR
ncbi:MAG TPA: hypothetical protein VGY55_13225 [Pirellulales bacterium]|jgi:hypothetical protein|nr:hypothetical protein [Pirellulales bacterium]